VRDSVISAEGLTRDFGATRAVDNLSIEVPRGAVFGFLGPNGSGKTTTIRMLLGLLEPTSGKATVLGHDVVRQSDEIRRLSGCLLEYSGLYERLSAEDNLDLFGRIWGIPLAARRTRIQEVLQSFGLWERRKDPAGKWSRGMKQKLAVARALLHRPALIFLDEPTAGLDPLAAANLRDELLALSRREGVTVFLTTHNLNEAEKLCARVAVIRRGRLLAEGPPEELRKQKAGQRAEIVGRGFDERVLAVLRERPEVRSATIQEGRLCIELQNNARISPLVPVLISAGVEIEEIRRERATLEEMFLTLMQETEP
jgi:ABC-2 type transport system ATP-binding protein